MTTDTKPIDFVSCELSFPFSYLFIGFLASILSAQSNIPVICEATYRDVKVIGSYLISSLSIWNQVLFSLTVRVLWQW